MPTRQRLIVAALGLAWLALLLMAVRDPKTSVVDLAGLVAAGLAVILFAVWRLSSGQPTTENATMARSSWIIIFGLLCAALAAFLLLGEW